MNSFCITSFELISCWSQCAVTLEMIHNIIRMICSIFNSNAISLFVICGQLLVIYNKTIAQNLSEIVSNPSTNFNCNNAIWSILSQFKVLREVRRKLFYDYQFILIGNVFLSVLLIFSCSYYFIEFLGLTSVGIFCEVTVITQYIFRVWLICHTADRIHSSVSIIMREIK